MPICKLEFDEPHGGETSLQPLGFLQVEPPKQLDDSAGKSCCGAVLAELCIMVRRDRWGVSL